MPQRTTTSSSSTAIGSAEFDILKSSHRFLRDDDDDGRSLSWDDRLAKKYYDNLYREFAVCDLKHYKSGNFALRWRTEAEVLSGTGEESCGNTRCSHSELTGPEPGRAPPLTTLELPFAYSEHGEDKSALVKIVLCPRCCKKLMWKRRKDKERKEEENDDVRRAGRESSNEGSQEPEGREGGGGNVRSMAAVVPASAHRKHPPQHDDYDKSESRRAIPGHDQTRTRTRGREGGDRSSYRREPEREERRKVDRGRMQSSRSRSPKRRREPEERYTHHQSHLHQP